MTDDPKTENSKPETSRADRDEESYVIDAGLKLLKVLESLEGRNFEPVNITRAVGRTGFSRDFVRRALITLKKSGWAKQLAPDGRDSNFVLGPKAENMARSLTASLIQAPARSQNRLL